LATRSILLAIILSGVLAYSFYLWAAPPASMIVRMESAAELRIDGESLTRDQALDMMREAVLDNPALEITIEVPADMPAGDVISLTQDLETVGGKYDIETRSAFDRSGPRF